MGQVPRGNSGKRTLRFSSTGGGLSVVFQLIKEIYFLVKVKFCSYPRKKIKEVYHVLFVLNEIFFSNRHRFKLKEDVGHTSSRLCNIEKPVDPAVRLAPLPPRRHFQLL